MKEEVSQLSKFCEEIRGNLVRVLDEIEKYKKEDDQLKKDELRVQTEKSNLIPKISQEEEDLKAKLKQTKSKMDSFIKGSSGLWILFILSYIMGFVLNVIQDTSDVKNNVWMSSHLSFVRMSSILFISLYIRTFHILVGLYRYIYVVLIQ